MADTVEAAEAEARRYLRWFPEWMREGRGEEAVGLVLDQVPADAVHLPLRSRLDLVRAGLHARRRGAPPLRVWSVVSTARRLDVAGRGPAVPLEWRPWLVTKLRRRSFAWQCAFWGEGWLWIYSVVLALNLTRAAEGVDLLIAIGAGVLLATLSCGRFVLFRRRAWRAALLAANGLGDDGRPLPPDEVTVTWVKPTFQNVWVLPFAVAATVGSALAPIIWVVLEEPPPNGGFRSSSWTAAAFAAIVLGSVAWTKARVRGVGPVPSGGAGPLTRRADLLLAAVYGGAAGASVALCLALASMVLAFHPAVLLAPLLGSGLALAILVAVERSVGRPLGSWDVMPGQGPQQVVRRLDDHPPSTQGPDTPAFG